MCEEDQIPLLNEETRSKNGLTQYGSYLLWKGKGFSYQQNISALEALGCTVVGTDGEGNIQIRSPIGTVGRLIHAK